MRPDERRGNLFVKLARRAVSAIAAFKLGFCFENILHAGAIKFFSLAHCLLEQDARAFLRQRQNRGISNFQELHRHMTV